MIHGAGIIVVGYDGVVLMQHPCYPAGSVGEREDHREAAK